MPIGGKMGDIDALRQRAIHASIAVRFFHASRVGKVFSCAAERIAFAERLCARRATESDKQGGILVEP